MKTFIITILAAIVFAMPVLAQSTWSPEGYFLWERNETAWNHILIDMNLNTDRTKIGFYGDWAGDDEYGLEFGPYFTYRLEYQPVTLKPGVQLTFTDGLYIVPIVKVDKEFSICSYPAHFDGFFLLYNPVEVPEGTDLTSKFVIFPAEVKVDVHKYWQVGWRYTGGFIDDAPDTWAHGPLVRYLYTEQIQVKGYVLNDRDVGTKVGVDIDYKF